MMNNLPQQLDSVDHKLFPKGRSLTNFVVYVPQPLSAPTVVDGNGGSGGMRSPNEEVVEESSRAEDDSSLIPGQVEAGFMGNLFG